MAQRTGYDSKIIELEKAMSAMTTVVERLSNEFWNHDGGPGLKTIVTAYIAGETQRHASEKEFHEQRDKEIKEAIVAADKKRNDAIAENERKLLERDRRMNFRLALGVFMIGVLTLILGVLVFREGQRQKHGDFTTAQPDSALSSSQPQDAGGTMIPNH